VRREVAGVLLYYGYNRSIGTKHHMGSVIRIVVAANDPVLCELFCEQLSTVPDWEVVGAVGTGRAAIAAVAQLKPDVVALDADLPRVSGLEILPVVRWYSPKTKVIVLSGHDEEAIILEALELGAKGYIVKGERADIIKAIRVVHNGEIWAGRRVVARLLERFVALTNGTFQETGSAPAPVRDVVH